MIVTGGSGFIGSNFIKRYGGESFDRKDGKDLLTEKLPKFDSIVHLAAEPGIPFSIENPIASHHNNELTTFIVLNEAVKNNAKVVLASSAAAENGNTPYAAFKAAGEMYAKAYEETYGLDVIVLRFANVYGPRSKHKSSVVAQMCKDALTKGVVFVNGGFSRDFIHVNDVCRAINKSISSDYSGVLNVGTGTLTPIDELAIMISDITGAEIRIMPPRKGDLEVVAMDISKTEDVLDWKTNIDIHEGILTTLAWFENEL